MKHVLTAGNCSLSSTDNGRDSADAHIVLIKDGEAPGVVFVGDALGGRELLEGQELAAVHRVDQILAQAQRVEAEVHLEEGYDDLQRRKLLLLVACADAHCSGHVAAHFQCHTQAWNFFAPHVGLHAGDI